VDWLIDDGSDMWAEQGQPCFTVYKAQILYACEKPALVWVSAKLEFSGKPLTVWYEYQYSILKHLQRIPNSRKLANGPISILHDQYSGYGRVNHQVINPPLTAIFILSLERGDRLSVFFRVRRSLCDGPRADEPCSDVLVYGELRIREILQ
jgi:hypothetical protein